jgi:bacterioferritin
MVLTTQLNTGDAKNSAFILDLDAIKKRARTHLEAGAVTHGNDLERHTIIKLLDASLATELVCVLRYRQHHFTSAKLGGIAGFALSEELMKHAQEEQSHADRLAERIVQLGGSPDFAPDTLARRSHTDYMVSDSLRGMLTEDLVAERIAIEIYASSARFIGDKDITTRRLLEDILAEEEHHADELSDLLKRVPLSA